MNADISSLLNLLVVVLIVGAIVVVVLWVVRAASDTRSARPARPVVEERQPVVADRHGGLSAGWYPDQNDPGMSRYFDGRMWTTATRPPS